MDTHIVTLAWLEGEGRKSGLHIKFLRGFPTNIEEYFRVEWEGKPRYFKTINVVTGINSHFPLTVTAKEAGYWGSLLSSRKDFDIRDLLNLEVLKVVDKAEIEMIKDASSLC